MPYSGQPQGRGSDAPASPGSERVRRAAQGWQPPWPRGQAPAAAGPAAAAAPPRAALRSPRALLEHAWQARRPAPDRFLGFGSPPTRALALAALQQGRGVGVHN
jgi:hypothetical protein